MNYVKTVRLLQSHGLDITSAKTAATALMLRDDARTAVKHVHDWDRLLSPLIQDIRVKGSTMHRWSKDADKAPVYSAYLQMLRKTRDVIKRARDLNLTNKSIPEIAADRNLSRNGLHWVDWVPPKVHTAFTVAFDELNTRPDPATGRPRKGPKITPFQTVQERSANDKRWDILTVRIATERAARAPLETTPPILLEALDYALDAVYARDVGQPAPVDWTHLLTPLLRQQLETSKEGGN